MSTRARPRRVGLALACGLCIAVLATARLYHADDAPFTPAADNEVLEHIPAGSGADPASAEMRALEAALARAPDDLGLIDQVARRYLDGARRSGETSRLAYAQAALGRWWAEPSAPPSMLVLRAAIKQARGASQDALVDLDAAIAADGSLAAEVWIERATALRALARYREASASCAHLRGKASELVEETCASFVDAVTDRAALARARLESLIDDPKSAPAELPRAKAVLGELELYRGASASAERDLRTAITADPNDVASRALLGDLLLDLGRPVDVMTLVAADEPNDVLRLRRAIAAAWLHAPQAMELANALRASFDELAARGDAARVREAARLALYVTDDVAAALPLAAAGFRARSEPWDARLLLEAAGEAARDPRTRDAALAAAAPAQKWLALSKCGWPPLARAVKALEKNAR